MAARFRFFFNAAFLVCCTQLGLCIMVIFMQHKNNWLKKLLVFLFKLAGLLILSLWLYAFIVRYMHSGAECSGDFIIGKSKAKNLLMIEGLFIKFSSLLVFFVLLLYFMGNVINCYQRISGGNQFQIQLEF